MRAKHTNGFLACAQCFAVACALVDLIFDFGGMHDQDSGVHRPSTRLLRGAFVWLAVTVGYSLWLGVEGRPLQNVATHRGGPAVAPRGGLSLQMPMSAGDMPNS